MPTIREIKSFASAVKESALALWGGVLSFCLAIAGFYIEPVALKYATWGVGIFCFMAAMFVAWINEYRRAEGEPIPEWMTTEVADKISILSGPQRQLLERFAYGQKMTSEQAAKYVGGPSHVAMNIHTQTGLINRVNDLWEIDPVFQRAVRKLLSSDSQT